MGSAVMKKTMYWFVLPALLFYLTFWIYPIVNLFVYSATDYTGLVKEYHYVGFENFRQIFKEGLATSSITNTLIYMMLFAIFVNVISLALAFLLDMKIRAVGFYRTLAYIPTLFSPIVVGYIWSYVYMPGNGMMATVITWLGLDGSSFNVLGDYRYALYGIIAVDVWKHIGTSTVIYLAGLQTIPHDLIEAGSIDGANGWQRTRWIRIPLLAPSITINLTLGVINGLKAFDYPFIMTNGGPGRSTSTLLVDVYRIAFKEMQYGKASALAVVSFGIIIALTALLVFRLNKREVSA